MINAWAGSAESFNGAWRLLRLLKARSLSPFRPLHPRPLVLEHLAHSVTMTSIEETIANLHDGYAVRCFSEVKTFMRFLPRVRPGLH
jgi:hypothetical protein